VPVDCYDEVLVIEEFERNKPGAYQLKYYAPGVGDIRVGWRGPEEEEKEGLELVKDVRLMHLQDRFWAMSCSAAYESAERTTRSLVNAHKASLSITQKVS
jgi:hypothetical protein